jgi:predicted PurR-regulated permease PerM
LNGSGTVRVLSRLWFVVIAVVVIAILYLAKVLFLPLAFSILFAFLLAPLVSGLERLRLPRALAAILVILGFAALLGTAGWMLFTQLVAVTNDLPTYRDNIAQKMQAIHSPSDSAFSRAGREVERLSEELGLANSDAVLHAQRPKQGNKPLGSTPQSPVEVHEVARPTGRLDQLGGILEPLTTSFLCVVFTFFVLLQREDLRNRIIHLSGDHNLSLMTQAMKDASARISRYFSLELLVNLSYGTLVFLALYFIGLPHAVLFGSLAGLLRFVPYLGAPIAGLLPTFLSLAVFHGWTHSILIVGTFTVLEVITANYAEPRIYGKHTGLSSLAILIAAAFWTLIWGPVGLVLSVPLTVCLVVMGRHVPALEFLTVMLGDQPVVPPATCYYQRLLAHDQHEAGEILETCLKDSSLENIYDSVLIPALVMSQQDRLQGDLDESTLDFLRQTTRELIDELGLRDTPDAEPVPSRENNLPAKVLCVPVRDETDELGSMMLAQLLESSGIQAIGIPVRRADEILAVISQENPEIVFLSGVPPFAMARAHRLYRSVRSRFPYVRLMIGIWGYTEDLGRASQKISRGESVHISITLADAAAQARSFIGVNGKSAEAAEASPASAA